MTLLCCNEKGLKSEFKIVIEGNSNNIFQDLEERNIIPECMLC